VRAALEDTAGVIDQTGDGEQLGVPERVILAPCLGVFEPRAPETVTTEGEIVYAGQVVGILKASGEDVPVCSAFTGFFMGLLAHEGERVREGQPVAWLRAVQ
jgi:multidrug efflux pump subunit AcrA (membrane-fusion protein)